MLPGIWPMLLLRGCFSVVFGALAVLSWDVVTLLRVLTAYAVADGTVAIALGRTRAADADAARHTLWPLMLSGLASLLSGVAAASVVHFGRALAILGIGLLTRGVLDVLAAITLREAGYDERLLGFAAALTLVAGIIVATCNLHGVAWRIVLAADCIAVGAAITALGFRIRVTGVGVQPDAPAFQRRSEMTWP